MSWKWNNHVFVLVFQNMQVLVWNLLWWIGLSLLDFYFLLFLFWGMGQGVTSQKWDISWAVFLLWSPIQNRPTPHCTKNSFKEHERPLTGRSIWDEFVRWENEQLLREPLLLATATEKASPSPWWFHRSQSPFNTCEIAQNTRNNLLTQGNDMISQVLMHTVLCIVHLWLPRAADFSTSCRSIRKKKKCF